MISALRRHTWLVLLLSAAIVLRVLLHLAYPHAFFLNDSRRYVVDAAGWAPNPIRPFGYSLFLKPLLPHMPLIVVAALQHLMALGLIAAGYAFLVRRNVRRPLAAVALAPLALDPRELLLEHFILAETLFVALAGAGLLALTWHRAVNLRLAAAAGLLLAGAALTRSVGLPLLLLTVAYLAIRRVGWRPLLAFSVAAVVPLAGYLALYHHARGVYAFNQYQGRFLYGRVMTFAECDRLKLTESQRLLCVAEPPGQRPGRPDSWVWGAYSPASLHYPSVKDDPVLTGFAVAAIEGQPLDYARVVLTETLWHFLPHPPTPPNPPCGYPTWRLPDRPGARCEAMYYLPTNRPADIPKRVVAGPDPIASALAAYGGLAPTGPVLALSLLIVLVGALWRPRRACRHDLADAALYASAGLVLIVVSVATSMFEPRYAVPALFFMPIGAALAAHRPLPTADARADS